MLKKFALLSLISFIFLPTTAGAAGLAPNAQSADTQVQSTYAATAPTGGYKLSAVKDLNMAQAGAMGSFVLPGAYQANVSNSVELNVLSEGLIAYYPLNTGTGNQTFDNTMNNVTAQLANNPLWVSGIMGGGLEFNGKDSFGEARDSEAFRSAKKASWSAWIKPTDVDRITQDQMIISKQGANNLRLFGRKLFGSFKINGQTQSVSGNTPLENNKWYHVASTYDGTTLKLYLNGNLEAELADLSGDIDFNTGDFEIARWQAKDPRYYQGTLDEIKVYNLPLSSEQVKLEYAANLSGVDSTQPLFNIAPSASQHSNITVKVKTDATGYQFTLNQNQPLTLVGGQTVVPGINSSLTQPQEWVEGVTSGLGAGIINGASVSLWGQYPNYRYGQLTNQPVILASTNTKLKNQFHELILQYRLDVPDNQAGGVYTNQNAYSGLLKP